MVNNYYYKLFDFAIKSSISFTKLRESSPAMPLSIW